MTWIEPLPGNDALPIYFEEITARAANFEPAFMLIVESFHKEEAQRWASEGPGWAPLSDATLATKAAYGWDQMMVRSGDLLGSLTGGAYSNTEMTPDFVEMTTSVPYAHFHQSGTTKMPQRKVVDITAATLVTWSMILETYLISGEEFEG